MKPPNALIGLGLCLVVALTWVISTRGRVSSLGNSPLTPTDKELESKNRESSQTSVLEAKQEIARPVLEKEMIAKLNDGTATPEERAQVAEAFRKKNTGTDQWLETQIGEAKVKVSNLENSHRQNLENLRETFRDLGVLDEN